MCITPLREIQKQIKKLKQIKIMLKKNCLMKNANNTDLFTDISQADLLQMVKSKLCIVWTIYRTDFKIKNNKNIKAFEQNILLKQCSHLVTDRETKKDYTLILILFLKRNLPWSSSLYIIFHLIYICLVFPTWFLLGIT